jgi:hypothetical protein
MFSGQNLTAKEVGATRMPGNGKNPVIWKWQLLHLGPAALSIPVKEKRALDIPPDLSKRAFIRATWALPGSVDFPPEIKLEAEWLGFLALCSFGP